jgi:hypothetical protein
MDSFHLASWRQVESAEGTVFRRPLGLTELGFYWDTANNGVATTINHLELEVEAGYEHVLSKDNLEVSWLRLKQRFPLLGASVEELPRSEHADFVLAESTLRCIRPGEINYLDDLDSAGDAAAFADKLHNGPPVLDNISLTRVWYGPEKGAPQKYHIYIPAVHHITDGIGNATITRELCRELASLSKNTTVAGRPLSDRLELILPLEALGPGSKLSTPRRRWRLAIASVIRNARMAKVAVSTLQESRSANSLIVFGTGRSYTAHATARASWHTDHFSPHAPYRTPYRIQNDYSGLPYPRHHTGKCATRA